MLAFAADAPAAITIAGPAVTELAVTELPVAGPAVGELAVAGIAAARLVVEGKRVLISTSVRDEAGATAVGARWLTGTGCGGDGEVLGAPATWRNDRAK